MLDQEIEREIIIAQRDEITEHAVYKRLSISVTDSHNRGVLDRIAEDELKHYNFWKKVYAPGDEAQ